MNESFSDYFGMSMHDAMEIRRKVAGYMADADHKYARETLDISSPMTSRRVRSALLEETCILHSEYGHLVRMLDIKNTSSLYTSREDVIQKFISDFLIFRDTAIWVLLMATLDASTQFQIHHCPTEAREDRLTGNLIALWASQCRQWSALADKALQAQGSALLLHELDLSIGGGEQANGGDFGVILDFEGGAEGSAPVRHIVPFVFQAKRYQRPNATVSQVSSGITPQRTLLQSNPCASAYIFYENSSKGIDRPLPVLVKPAAAVKSQNNTDVLEGSIDLASYLMVALADPSIGIRAVSPKDALNMIYDRASFDKLSALLVISSDGKAGPQYKNACSDVVNTRLQEPEPPEGGYEPPSP